MSFLRILLPCHQGCSFKIKWCCRGTFAYKQFSFVHFYMSRQLTIYAIPFAVYQLTVPLLALMKSLVEKMLGGMTWRARSKGAHGLITKVKHEWMNVCIQVYQSKDAQLKRLKTKEAEKKESGRKRAAMCLAWMKRCWRCWESTALYRIITSHSPTMTMPTWFYICY